MLIFTAAVADDLLVGLGLEDENLTDMLDGDRPASVDGRSLGIPGHGWLVLAARNAHQLRRRLEAALAPLSPRDTLPALRPVSGCYYAPVAVAGRTLHALGFAGAQLDALRGVPVPVGTSPPRLLVFHCRDRDEAEARFRSAGLVAAGTVTRLHGSSGVV